MPEPDFKTKLDSLLEKYSQAELAVILGISERSIVNYVKGYSTPHQKTVRKLSEIYMKENGTVRSYLEQRREIKTSDEPYLVPFVDIPAQAGYSKAYQQRDYIATLKRYPILPDVDPAGAVWRYFQIEGASMEPEFMSKDVILCSQVPRDDWGQFTNVHTYVVVTDTDLWIKDVVRLSETEWGLLSQNPEFEPFKVQVEDVRQLWVMRRHIKARAKKHRMYDLDEIKKKLNKQ